MGLRQFHSRYRATALEPLAERETRLGGTVTHM
jgi:hypothetical protein